MLNKIGAITFAIFVIVAVAAVIDSVASFSTDFQFFSLEDDGGADKDSGPTFQFYDPSTNEDLPDLIISDLTLSATAAREGENVIVHVTTKNIGKSTAGSSITRVVSTTRVGNGGNRDFSVSALSPGSSQTNSFVYTCGSSNVMFTGIADYNDIVTESKEGNNQLQNMLICEK